MNDEERKSSFSRMYSKYIYALRSLLISKNKFWMISQKKCRSSVNVNTEEFSYYNGYYFTCLYSDLSHCGVNIFFDHPTLNIFNRSPLFILYSVFDIRHLTFADSIGFFFPRKLKKKFEKYQNMAQPVSIFYLFYFFFLVQRIQSSLSVEDFKLFLFCR